MARYLYLGTSRDSEHGWKSVYKVKADDLSQVWSADHGNDIWGVVASANYIYICGGPSSKKTVRQYTIDGTAGWSAGNDNTNWMYDLALDSAHNTLYVVGFPGAGYQLNGFSTTDGSGGGITGFFTVLTNSISLHQDGDYLVRYMAGNYGSSRNATKEYVNADLHSQTTINKMRLDEAGNIYVVGGVATDSKTTRKYPANSDPYTFSTSATWTANHGATVYGLAIDSSGNVVTGGEVSSGITTRCYNSSGTQQWTANHGDTVWCCAFDADGNVYTGGVLSGGYSLRKYDSSGNLLYSADFGPIIRAIAVQDETAAVTLAGAASSTTTSSGRLHVKPLLGFPPSRLAAEILRDTPELFAPGTDIITPNLDQRYAFTDQELIDYSGHGHEILLNGSTGFITGENANSRYPIPRVNDDGLSTATWSGYASPSIKTDIGPALWDLTQAWAVECWYRRYGYTASQYHWYFGNADAYSPVLQHVYIAQGWFELAGTKHKRVLYTLSDANFAQHHLVLSYDGSGTLTLYVDAVPVASLSQNIAALNVQINSNARLYWGRNQGGSSQYQPTLCSCTYAYLALYLHALTLDRIQAHYRAGISAAEPLLRPFFAPILSPLWSIPGSH